MPEGTQGWVWNPDVQLVRDGEDGWSFEYESITAIRTWSGRDSAEYMTAVHEDGTVGLVKFCDWNDEGIPVYSPQEGNGEGAALVPDSSPLKAPILSLLGQL